MGKVKLNSLASKRGKEAVVLHVDDFLTHGHQEYLERNFCKYCGRNLT